MSRFDWVRRMGVHEAYHLSGTNRLIHWICIPLELLALVELLSLVAIGPIDLALAGVIALAPIFVATELLAGALMTLSLLGMRWLALRLTSGWVALDAALALALFAATFVFQTRVGHGRYEQGIDDTEKNLAEFRRTRNPVPLVLVFYYHLVEILFALGYRPALRQAVEAEREQELARIPGDPRRR